MLRCMATRSLVERVCDEFSCGEGAVYRDMRAITERWAQESAGMEVESKRDHLDRSLQLAAWMAFTDDPPQLRVAVRALHVRARLWGLDRVDIHVSVQKQVQELLEDVRPLISREAYGELIRAIAQVSGLDAVAAATDAGGGAGALRPAVAALPRSD